VNLKSAVLQTEFHIIYHDNSGGLVPGPSDWDIQAVMLVEDTAPWKEGKTAIDTADFSWAGPFLTDELRPSSQPAYYANQAVTIAVFEPEQIIYFRSTTTPPEPTPTPTPPPITQPLRTDQFLLFPRDD